MLFIFEDSEIGSNNWGSVCLCVGVRSAQAVHRQCSGWSRYAARRRSHMHAMGQRWQCQSSGKPVPNRWSPLQSSSSVECIDYRVNAHLTRLTSALLMIIEVVFVVLRRDLILGCLRSWHSWWAQAGERTGITGSDCSERTIHLKECSLFLWPCIPAHNSGVRV